MEDLPNGSSDSANFLPKASPSGPVVVGIGASAGGLNALKRFFQHVPADSGLAFVVIVHLSPDHESRMAEVLQPHVKMPVAQVNQTLPLERNHVYVIPPGRNLSSVDTHLRLSELSARREGRAPVDHFFRTLAQTHDGKAVGVILTGTGADGVLGIQEIKANGGFVIVQDPNEAEYDGMPRSAIATGSADLVLPLAQIPDAILSSIGTHPKLDISDAAEAASAIAEEAVRKIFAALRQRTGRDFSRYKRSTILRRIARRMQLRHVDEVQIYLEILTKERDELRMLSEDLLVNVTSFFRDPEVFEKLETELIPKLFTNRDSDEDLRIWSVGCATGEEAYSIAMLVMDEALRHTSAPRIQIFASDLHEQSLQRAREGLYLGDIEGDVSAARLHRYFRKEDGGYRIRKEVRELVIFAQHNLLGDPPFTRIDLVSCRNLLIYLQRDIQHDVMELFHYALKPQGYLVLGTSETSDASELFAVEDKKHCLYRKRNVPPPDPRLPVFSSIRARAIVEHPRMANHVSVPFGMLHQRMVERYGPPSLLVTADDKVVHFSDHSGRYLTHPGGEATANILKLVRPELRIELRAALHEARQRRQPTRSQPVMVRFNGESHLVILNVRPALEPEQEGFALVLFDEDDGTLQALYQPGDAAAGAGNGTAGRLALELDMTKQRLHEIVEEYETGQEEAKASNEELQSTNEELRSTLEELETSKEELQSINEELQTVNQENRNKVEELAQLSGDLQNLLSISDIATLFLDRSLRIMRFTPKVSDLFSIRLADRGRPLSDLTHRLGYPDLIADANQVLRELVPIEREVQDASNAWYLTRVRAYRSGEDRIEGVVITFVDISERKRHEDALRQSEQQLAHEAENMARLHQLVAGLLVSSDLSAALDAVLVAAMEITGTTMGNVQLANPTGDRLAIVTQRGFSPNFMECFESVTAQDTSSCGRAMRSRGRVMIEDVLADELYLPYREIAKAAGYRAVQSTPLLSRDNKLLGVLSTHFAQPTQLSDGVLRMLDLYCRQAAEFIEHVQTQELLRDNDRRKDEFLALLAHELRSPLGAIRNVVEVLKRKPAEEVRLNEVRDTIDRQSRSLARLVDDLLQLSGDLKGKLQLEKRPLELAPLIAQVVQESRSIAENEKHHVSLDLETPSPWVQGDPVRLTQVFANLFNNARKYTPAGGNIWVRLRRDHEHVVVSVRDSGVGIASEHLQRVFDLFYQVTPSDRRMREGLGIGLALAKSLIDLHGGTMEVVSDGVGKGSEFIVRLPAVAAGAAA